MKKRGGHSGRPGRGRGPGPRAKGKPATGVTGHGGAVGASGAGGNRARGTRPTDWGQVADWYDQLVGDEGSDFHREVIFPGVLRLLGRLPVDAPVLDVACGQGALARLLFRQGMTVTGVDAARALVEKAKQHNAALAQGAGDAVTPLPSYAVGDARDLKFLPESHFAAATCILAIQNIDLLPPVFAGLSRALRPMGRVVVVMMHPCFRGPKATSWGWDEEAGVQYRRVDRYLLSRKEPIVTHPGRKTGEYTWTFHRPIQSYVRAMRGAGLLIDAIEEWPSHKVSDSGHRAPAENMARKEIPMFMAIRAVRVDVA